MLIISVLVVFISSSLLAAVATLVASLVLQRKQQISGAALQPESDLDEDGPTILKLDDLSSIAPWGSILNQFDFADAMRAQISEAELQWSVGRLTAMMLLVSAFSLAVLSSLGWLPLWLSFFVACGCALLPYGYVLRRRAKRFRQFEQQFPDALDFLARSLRAGHPLPMCLELLAQEEAPPLSIEMRTTADERRLGLPLDQALDNLSRRLPLLNVRVFVAAVKLQSRTGGKLSEVLGGLAENMREAEAVEGEVRALAAHGRITGVILTALPVGIALLMTAVNPGYLNILLENPTGRQLIVVCIVALAAAHFVIRRIVDIRL
jgi:tight adherence protein B